LNFEAQRVVAAARSIAKIPAGCAKVSLCGWRTSLNIKSDIENMDWIKFGIGMLYLKKNRNKDAENIFSTLLKDNPSYGPAIAQFGFIRKNEGKKNESLAYFRKAINYLSNDELGTYLKGVLYKECGKYNDALGQFQKFLKKNPYHIDSMIKMALIYGNKDDFDNSISLINDAYKKNNEIMDCFSILGWIKAEKHDWYGAIEIMSKDIAGKRISPSWKINLAQLYGHINDYETAVNLIDQAYSEDRSLKSGYARLSWIKFKKGDWSGANAIMRKDIVSGRISSGWKVNSAIIESRNGHWTEAMSIIKNAYYKNRSLCDGYSIIGWVGYLIGKGVEFFNEQIMKDEILKRCSSNVTMFKGLYLTIINRFEEVYRELETVYMREPMNRNWLSSIGWLNIKLQKQNYGLQLMEHDFQNGRMDKNWMPSYSLALSICGEKDRALAAINDCYSSELCYEKIVIGYLECPDYRLSVNELRDIILHGKDLKIR
jgi:tetratricopeptide (TPR) repeat protein